MLGSNWLTPLTLVAAAAGLVLTLAPSPAEACGGTFCDAGPTVMPVDQSGENILFWIDEAGGEPHTEAHIQIQYEGDADQFAWLVPVSTVPEVLVGSQALFDNLLAASVPTITLNTRFDGDCGSDIAIGCAMGDDASFAGDSGFDSGGFGETGSDDGGAEILDRGFAGAFEYVVLTGSSVDEIVDWLDAAGYAQNPAAPPILDEYLQDGFVFVAFKLRGGVGIDEIHPIAIRYPGVEPCIPIKLTRIAAVEDMAIRALFLGHSRVAPLNWPHVLVNWAKLDWISLGIDDYRELVAEAIDEAGGRAFVTEYAGPDDVVSIVGIEHPAWDSAEFVGIDPLAVVDTLVSQQLMLCDDEAACEFRHPQVRGLLDRYLPTPDGVEAEAFWSCVECYAALVDQAAWAAQPGFAAEFDERITAPAKHATAMLVDATYLTRLYTLISPHEMLEDPMFHATESLPVVDGAITATRVNTCDDAPTYIEFEGGRKVALDSSLSYPAFSAMTSAERIERVPSVGPPQVEANNSGAIDDIIDDYNRDKLIGPSPWSCSLARLRPEAMLAMFALFGLVWLQRAPKSSRQNRS